MPFLSVRPRPQGLEEEGAIPHSRLSFPQDWEREYASQLLLLPFLTRLSSTSGLGERNCGALPDLGGS